MQLIGIVALLAVTLIVIAYAVYLIDQELIYRKWMKSVEQRDTFK